MLPVRFDDSELPGLLPDVKYLWAKDYTPERLAADPGDETEGPRVMVQLEGRPIEAVPSFFDLAKEAEEGREELEDEKSE